VRPIPQLRVHRRCAPTRDAHAIYTLFDGQIGDPAWDWHKLLVHVELVPERAADRRLRVQFRDVLGRWMDASYGRLVDVHEVAADDPPYAVLGYAHGPTLADVCRELSATGRPLPGHIAEHMMEELEAGRRVLAAAGLAHGFWSAHITVTSEGLKLGPQAWWDDRASAAGDEALLEALVETLVGLTRQQARPTPGYHATHAEIWRFARELCGEPRLAWEPT
jgi:hypothetical protein